MGNKPVAVVISDVHYSLATLEVADACMRLAINKANQFSVPLIVAGDLHDTKANMRAECINAMINTFKYCHIKPYVLVGNHCKINEKSEGHALNFLQELAIIVDEPMDLPMTGTHGIPYYHDVNELRGYLKTIPKGSTLVMHQGLSGSDSGEYIQDHSALNPDDVADFRVISGHYHRRQDIKTGRPRKGAVGLFSYIGNPYTLNFGEANHPKKGFQILTDDGTLEFVPTHQREHIKFQINAELFGGDSISSVIPPSAFVEKNDLLWLVVHGTQEQLSKVTKDSLRIIWPNLPGDFRLTLEPTEDVHKSVYTQASGGELLDQLIDESTQVSDDTKSRLKSLWKTLKEDTNESSQRISKKLR